MPLRHTADGDPVRYHRSASGTTVVAAPALALTAREAGCDERVIPAAAPADHSAMIADGSSATGGAPPEARDWPGRALLRLVIDSLPFAVCCIDDSERYAFANRLHGEWFGVPAEQLAGRRLREVLGEHAYGALAPQLHAALRGTGVTVDTAITCRAGRTRSVRAQYVPCRDESETRVTGCVAVLTERGAQEHDTPGHGRLLELAHSARLALIGETAGMLTHELAQPLAAISNYSSAASLLLQQGRGDEVHQITQQLGLHARRALAIVQGLRRFLRKQGDEREAIEMRDLVQGALQMLQWETDARRVAVRFESAMSLPVVYGDRTLIEQVVLNLLRNALDAVRDGAGREAPIVVAVIPADGAVEVAVRDRGPGLAPEARAHLFEPFFTTKREGLGVGLAICRRIVETHGGRLWAEDNDDGPGTTFRFALPAR